MTKAKFTRKGVIMNQLIQLRDRLNSYETTKVESIVLDHAIKEIYDFLEDKKLA